MSQLTAGQFIRAVILRGIIIVLPIACLVLGSLYWNIDSVVSRRLTMHNHGSFSAVYSRPSVFEAGVPTTSQAIVARLRRREYKELSTQPTRAGQYQCDSQSCTIFLRSSASFLKASGSSRTSGSTYLSMVDQDSQSSIVTVRFIDGKIVNRKGELLDELALEPVILSALGRGEVRAATHLSLEQVPKNVIHALLSTEDQRFYSHWGIDPIGITRAMAKNFMAGGWVEGGSTITQQLAKNLLFTPKKTLSRKIKEFLAALSLEQRLSKREILTMYLNEVYFSQEGSIAIHGIQEAARTFFGKNAQELSLAQAATLIGLIKAPSYYSPRRHPERALARRNVVLENMRLQNYISSEQATQAKAKPLTLVPSSYKRQDSPYFMAHLEKELERSFQIESDPRAGLQVKTFIDEEYQACAEKAVQETGKELDKNFPSKDPQARPEQALVALDSRNGAVLAWVGGRDFRKNQFDHVAQAKRQIGSTIKPFLYLTAMDPTLNDYKVATPISILGDEPTDITLLNQQTWRPENFDHKYRGDVTLRYALEKSLNIPAVYVAQRVGVERIKETLERFRVAEEVPAVPALALGAVETSLLELTASFSALSQLGLYSHPRLFEHVVDPDGNLLASLPQLNTKVNDPGPVFLVVDMMRGVIQRGTGQKALAAGFRYPAAGKTGTSDSSRDAWFVGFTPSLAVGVWTGYDDNRKTRLTGGSASAPTWGRFMQCISPFLKNEQFLPPPTVRMVTLDKRTRKRFFSDCAPSEEFQIKEIFLRGTEPEYSCADQPHRRARRAPIPVQKRRPSGTSFWDSLFDW